MGAASTKQLILIVAGNPGSLKRILTQFSNAGLEPHLILKSNTNLAQEMIRAAVRDGAFGDHKAIMGEVRLLMRDTGSGKFENAYSNPRPIRVSQLLDAALGMNAAKVEGVQDDDDTEPGNQWAL